jgi:gamma-glutamyltranspeptidase/glutathione hydrolase
MVAAASPPAARAGAEVLAAGGHAVDAAIAAALVMGVVEPIDCGIAAGGFLVLYEAETGAAHALDFMGAAPRAARYELEPELGDFLKDFRIRVKDRANEMGARAVAVPGALRGFEAAHRRFGRLPWADLVAPAARVAREGFPVDGYLARRIAENQDYLAHFPESRRLLHGADGPRRAGERMASPDLARSLEAVAREGADALYTGSLAGPLLDEMRRGGGFLDEEDLRAYRVHWRRPAEGRFAGCRVWSMAPPSAGALVIAVLQALDGRLDGAALARQDPAVLDRVLRAMRAAQAARAAHLGDPLFARVPVERWTGAEFAATLACEGPETTSLSAVDRDGNAASLTYSNMNFAGVTVPGTGIVLNNQMLLFNPLPGTANSLEPGRRPASSMCPTVLARDGRVRLALGASGGPRIPTAIVWVTLNHLLAGLPIDRAVAQWRAHHEGGVVDVERSLAAAAGPALEARGWRLDAMDDHHRLLALCQAVAVDADGRVTGAGDPRGDGVAVAEKTS